MDDDFQRQLELEALEAKSKGDQTAANASEYTDATGTTFEWDHTKRAWFPRLDDNFMAMYQAQYGAADSTAVDAKEASNVNDKEGELQQTDNAEQPSSSDSKGNDNLPSSSDVKPESSSETVKRKAEEEEPTWFEVDDEHNTQVYVSKLPLDMNEEEFVALMQKCGFVMKDLETNQYKIKMYKDKEGKFKGDALCGYIKRESVELALQILDEYNVRNNIISVERAKFTLKGSYDPTKKPRKNKRSKDKLKKKINALLDWRPEKITGERPKCEKVVIIKNMFEMMDFAADPRLILEYRNDLRDECGEKCGDVKKVDIYDNNPEGVAAVFFNEFESADQCVKLMNGRFFAGRQLTSFHWDGKTRYKIQETEEEAEKRMKDWESFLEEDKDNKS